MKAIKFLPAFLLLISLNNSYAQNSVPPVFKTQMQTVLTDYLQLKSALIHRDAKKINVASGQLLTASKAVKTEGLTKDDLSEWNRYSGDIQSNVEAVYASTDVLNQLKNFSNLSVPLYNAVKYFKISTQKFYYNYCPMANGDKGGYWLSNNKALVNPYFKGVIMGCEVQRDSF